jgi:nucleoside-diphosphate-sugar epimerase
MCRKVIEALDSGNMAIDIWGDGTQTRSYCFIDDCTLGIDQIMHCKDLIATPINLGSSELISVDDLVSMVESIAGVKLKRTYDPTAPKGVAGRNSDNTFIEKVLGWEPHLPLRTGMERTYAWIKEQYADRKAGKRVVKD